MPAIALAHGAQVRPLLVGHHLAQHGAVHDHPQHDPLVRSVGSRAQPVTVSEPAVSR